MDVFVVAKQQSLFTDRVIVNDSHCRAAGIRIRHRVWKPLCIVFLAVFLDQADTCRLLFVWEGPFRLQPRLFQSLFSRSPWRWLTESTPVPAALLQQDSHQCCFSSLSSHRWLTEDGVKESCTDMKIQLLIVNMKLARGVELRETGKYQRTNEQHE